MAEELSAAFRQALVGKNLEVLFEEESDGFFTGHAMNYVKVWTEGTDLHNQVKTVKITGLHKEGLVGTPED